MSSEIGNRQSAIGNSLHVVLVAAENAALKGGKEGGMGDVIQGLSKALTVKGVKVTVITPSYGFLHTQNPSTFVETISFTFRGEEYSGELWKVNEAGDCMQLLFEHPEIRGNPLYYDDPSDTPFARDATKFALFCSAVGTYLKGIKKPFTLHLHDWHTANLFMLAELHPDFTFLRELPTLFTIHNLSIQGTRPMMGNPSSLETWFPELFHETGWISLWKDPRYADACYTPMAAGIRFADKVNTVSPSYAEEILKPSDGESGLVRGEGLEEFLQNAAAGKRLFGILNGIDYPNRERVDESPSTQNKTLLFQKITSEVRKWISATSDADVIAECEDILFRLGRLQTDGTGMVLTSVGRIVDQKVRLFLQRGSGGDAAIESILESLEERKGALIVLGSGDTWFEGAFRAVAKASRRFVFINRYSSSLADALYLHGDLFLMPSLYEPCGISQMLAMRESQPCLVHRTGGLKDTVRNMETGFTFEGENPQEMADAFATSLKNALELFSNNKSRWQQICANARKQRFTWEVAAERYLELIVSNSPPQPPLLQERRRPDQQ
ncbi:MAG TPA: glycogen/starch synthase [Bacteroidota bacterium]|nr:glycogen/starch synthase [Bacteroidota bacterium]